MKAARIPAPGLLLGSHPERHDDTPSMVTRVLRALRTAPRGNHTPFIAAVRARQRSIVGEMTQQLTARIARLRTQFTRDGLSEAAQIEAFAIISIVSQRELAVAPFDVQLTAARIMLDGHLAEMATGEGKTLAAAITAATAALAGSPVHVITANDYLVARDARELLPLYRALGLTVGAVDQAMTLAARRAAYACDITYCTAKTLVFDYLRDGVSTPRRSVPEQHAAALTVAAPAPRLLRGLCMAIIDEADSILIDEARVPLILSQPVSGPAPAYLHAAWSLSATLVADTHFVADAAARSVQLTAAGREFLQHATASGTWLNQRHAADLVTLALTARHMLQLGRDYVVEQDKVHIVDDTTGRKAAGRSWSGGLHQLVEIKQGCKPSARVETVAQITYQRFFPRYLRLCGMSGTLLESRRELRSIYNVGVVQVALRLPGRRALLPSRVFAHAAARWTAVVARVGELHAAGRPVLIGTDSVADSEILSRQLESAGLAHAVLNATQDQHEAAVVAAAGAEAAITVATNIAGRGTDILLSAASRASGGLHIICCQQNSARRIDRQLLGRCARQGDPGSAEYFIALDGPLLAQNRIVNKIIFTFKNKELYNYHLILPLLRQAQRAGENRHAAERAALMRQDKRLGDWFAFSGPEI